MSENKSFVKSVLVKRDLLFVLLFTLFAAIYYSPFLSEGPLNNHLWRQTDCLSLTWHFYEGNGLFEPEMHCQLADDHTSGKSAGEFPILYYLVGQIWKITGVSYLAYRLFYLLILFFGLYAFYRSLLIILDNRLWALVLTGLLFTSPVYAVYSVGFLTDSPAFSFILIALFLMIRYHQRGKLWILCLSMMFFALAGLVKVSSLIAFFFLLFILLLETLSVKSLGNKKLFRKHAYEWAGFMGVILVVFAWYFYAKLYNDQHGFKYTFNEIHPVWKLDGSGGSALIIGLKNYTSIVFFSRPVLYALLFLGILNLFLAKKIPLIAYLSNILVIMGGITYFTLWGALMGNHDYYFNALLVLYPGIIIPFVLFIRSHYPSLANGRVMKVFLITFVLFNFIYCLNVVQLKTRADKGDFVMIGNHEFVDHMKWANKDATENWNRFKEMRPYLEELGVGENDLVISLPDHSFNISLFLSGQKGWTNFKQYEHGEDLSYLIGKGARYLFISDERLLQEAFLQPFLVKQVGGFRGIRIYELPPQSQ